MILVFFWNQRLYPAEVHVASKVVWDANPDASEQAATTNKRRRLNDSTRCRYKNTLSFPRIFSLTPQGSPPFSPCSATQHTVTMQLSHSFSFLLTGLLFVFAQVEASPTKREPGIVTLPLKRLPQSTDVHPSIVRLTLSVHPLQGIVVLITLPPPSCCNSTSIVATAVMPE